MNVLERLEAVIAARKASADQAGSHTARLLAQGAAHVARKFGEEAIETVIAGAGGDRAALVGEAADALYHLLVLLAARGVPFAEVLAELERREARSGVVEKAARVDVSVREARGPAELAECLRIRNLVFVREQGVSTEDEVDGLDPICRHYLASHGAAAIGAARLKPIEGGVKVQRVAVLAEARGAGVGLALMRRMIADARAETPGARVVLSSQISAVAFYERLGFVAQGPIYLDAGIEHRDMSLES